MRLHAGRALSCGAQRSSFRTVSCITSLFTPPRRAINSRRRGEGWRNEGDAGRHGRNKDVQRQGPVTVTKGGLQFYDSRPRRNRLEISVIASPKPSTERADALTEQLLEQRAAFLRFLTAKVESGAAGCSSCVAGNRSAIAA